MDANIPHVGKRNNEKLRSLQKLSVVVPCFNEEEVLELTLRRLKACSEAWPDFELIFVDDGSSDATGGILRSAAAKDDRIKVLDLSRNFGHQAAVSAGLAYASGDATVLIDADLQDPPEVIVQLIARWEEGFEVAYGVRVSRDGESMAKKISSRIFYRMLDRLTETKIPLDTGDFRIIDSKIVSLIRQMPEQNRFLRGMIAWTGFRQIAVPYRRDSRAAGETKYTLRKMLQLASAGVFSFSLKPLRISIYFGLWSSALAAAGIVYVLWTRLATNNWVDGWAGVLIAILFLGGAQLITIGVLGEYLGMVFTQSQGRPTYIIRTEIGFETKGSDPRPLT